MLFNHRVQHAVEANAPPRARDCVHDHLIDIAVRSVDNVLDSSARGQFAEIKWLAERGSYKIFVSDIPECSSFSLPPHQFEPCPMKDLFNLGVAHARSGKAWTPGNQGPTTAPAASGETRPEPSSAPHMSKN